MVATAILVLGGLIVVGAILIYFLERGTNPQVHSIGSGFEWVALTLVASSPWDVKTAGGQVIVYAMGLVKPASVGILIAALTTKMIDLVRKRGTGTGRARVRDHIVICGWSSKGTEILNEIRGRDDAESGRPVVILAPLGSNPSRDELTTFVAGDPTEERDLKRAGIQRARTAIILADNSYPDIDAEDMDSRTLLTALAVESLNPVCYTCVEVIHSKNREHFTRTKADELVVSAHLTGALLANSAVTHGLSRVVGDLITFPIGDEFYWVGVPSELNGRTFHDALIVLKQGHDCIAIALESDGKYITNPPADRELRRDDRLLVIAKSQPFAPPNSHRRVRGRSGGDGATGGAAPAGTGWMSRWLGRQGARRKGSISPGG